MTRENYKKLEAAGYTGPDTGTCFPAAIDLMSDENIISPETYLSYRTEYIAQSLFGTNAKESRNVYLKVLEDAGAGGIKGYNSRNVSTVEKCSKVLDNLREGGFRIVAVVSDDEHDVGLKPVKDGWEMVGTSIPTDDGEVLDSSEIFPHLSKRKERWKGKKLPNIMAIAPEKKKKIK